MEQPFQRPTTFQDKLLGACLSILSILSVFLVACWTLWPASDANSAERLHTTSSMLDDASAYKMLAQGGRPHERANGSTLLHEGDLCPLARILQQRVVLGVGVIGGSVSAGHCLKEGERTYLWLLSRVLSNQTSISRQSGDQPRRRTQRRVRQFNGARGATTLKLSAYCMAEMVPAAANVVIIEYSINGGVSAADADAVVSQAITAHGAAIVLSVRRDPLTWELAMHRGRLHVPVVELRGPLRQDQAYLAKDGHHLSGAGHSLAAFGLYALFQRAWKKRALCDVTAGSHDTSPSSQLSAISPSKAHSKAIAHPRTPRTAFTCDCDCLTAFDADDRGCFRPSRPPNALWHFTHVRGWPTKRLWSTVGNARQRNVGSALEFALPGASRHTWRTVAVGMLQSNGVRGDPTTTALGQAAVLLVHGDGRVEFARNCTGRRDQKPVWTIQQLCEIAQPVPRTATHVRIVLNGQLGATNFAVTGIFSRQHTGG